MPAIDRYPCAEGAVGRAASGRPSPRDRAFRPDLNDTLEARALLSVMMPAAVHRLDVAGIQQKNIPFPTSAGRSGLLDVYTPVTPAPPGGYPVLVAIHGGGWRRFDKSSYGARIASGFVDKGYVVVAPNYQLSAPGTPSWPFNLEDVQGAVAWVRGQAAARDVNPGEIAAIGESAGANLAALLGTSSPRSGDSAVSGAVDAVIAFSTPTDLTSLYSESAGAGKAAAQFLGGSPSAVPANYTAASPLDNISPGDPPMLLIHGQEDSLIPISQSVAMARALSVVGVRNQLIRVRGGHNLDFPGRYFKLIPQILEFLRVTWKD